MNHLSENLLIKKLIYKKKNHTMFTYTEFLNEYQHYGNFHGSIKYTDWSDFKEKLKIAINTGFKTEEELVKLMEMNFDSYTKIRENMILNWKDSVTKSLLHTVAQIGQKIPKKGADIFKDLKQQTLFCVVASNGTTTNNIFGQSNSVDGLRMISRFDFDRVKNKDPKITKYDKITQKYVMNPYVYFGDIPAYTSTDENTNRKINEIVQYVWLYAFYHHYIMKKNNIKLPTYIYRGIRVSTLNGKIIDEIVKQAKEKQQTKKHSEFCKFYIDLLIDYITKNGISKITDGKLLSFTESKDIAAYFANKEGIILRVDPKKVEIVTSPKTEEYFQQTDWVSNKKEKEYIIKVPVNYKFTKDDIEIVHGYYYLEIDSPLAVQFFDHDNKKATYTLDDINITARYVWHSNTNGSIIFDNESEEGFNSWGLSRQKFKKTFKIDPMPTKENLDRITNFKISDTKRW
jgi:hypothetical protein